jgi:hypothetical protein
MASVRESGRLFELSLMDWLILLAGVALARVVALVFLTH